MLNTECKQCNRKWHYTNAKYCSMCGKKLVEETEFKAGDIVASKVLSCDINEVSLGVFKNDTRHATSEEITEYEAALTFHKHGRKPFELKWGDLIKDGNSNRGVVVNPYIYIKEMFYKSGYELLATAEEVNEWLGADDE